MVETAAKPQKFAKIVRLLKFNNPGYPIDGNRWSENQSINRYQWIKLVNWHRLVSVNRWSIDNHQKPFIDCYRLAQQPRTDVTRATCPITRHFRKLVKQFRRSLLKTKPECTPLPCTGITHLPVIAFPYHYVYARSPGRGFTEYKEHRQRLSFLPFWGERRWIVIANKKRGERGNAIKVVHYFATTNAAVVGNFIHCQSTISVTKIFLWRHDVTIFRFLKSV